jgi:hypothetical protein
MKTEVLVECRSPRCKEPPADGRRFCVFHAAILDGVKASERADAAKVRSTIRRPNAQPTCCAPHCQEPRVLAERYCPACQAAGWREEDSDL